MVMIVEVLNMLITLSQDNQSSLRLTSVKYVIILYIKYNTIVTNTPGFANLLREK